MKKIRIRGGGNWKKETKTLCLAVSMNSPNCAGNNFSAALAFAEKQGKPFFVDVSDTLHVPNIIAQGATQSKAVEYAKALGDKWLSGHEKCLGGARVIRWSFWEEQPGYEAVREKFYWLFDKEAAFRKIVMKDVGCFTARNPERQNQRFLKASIAYALDECAGKTMQGRVYPGLGILYPGHELGCLTAVRDGKIEGAPEGLEYTRHIRYTIETRSGSSTSRPEEPRNRIAC